MLDQARVKRAAERRLGWEAQLHSEVAFQRGSFSLTVWTSLGPLPARHVAILETKDAVRPTTRSMGDFEVCLKTVRPDLRDLDLIEDLVGKAAPPQRSIVRSSKSLGWLEKYRSVWHPPEFIEGDLVFFCSDFTKGRFEKFTISACYDLRVEDLGPGKRIAKR